MHDSVPRDSTGRRQEYRPRRERLDVATPRSALIVPGSQLLPFTLAGLHILKLVDVSMTLIYLQY